MQILKAITASAVGLFIATAAFAADARPVDYQHVELNSADARLAWGDYVESGALSDPVWDNVFFARMKTPEGDDLILSEMVSTAGCGSVECPVRIFRNGKLVYENTECRYMEKHFLNASMNTVFYCDRAVPTVAEVKE